MSELFNVRALKAKKTSARCKPEQNFLRDEIGRTLENRLSLLGLQKDLKNTLYLGEHFNQNNSYKYYQPLFDQCPLPFSDKTFDLIIDHMTLHWISDLPFYLKEVQRIMAPQGIYLAGFLAEKTLQELRHSLLELDLEVFQGAKARVSPLLKTQSVPDLFKHLGFQTCIVDHEEIKVVYKDVYHMIQDLRSMGETNSLFESDPNQKILYHRSYFQKLNDLMSRNFPGPKGTGIQVTFDLTYVCASPRIMSKAS